MTNPPFPGIDPNQLAMARAFAGAAQGDTSGITPATPDQTASAPSPLPASSPFDIASIVRNLAQIPEYAGPSRQLSDIGSQEQDIRQQMSDMPVPKMGFHPEFQKGHFLHNLGQALLAVAASTRPGQAVQETVYGPGIQEYKTKRDTLVNQLATLKAQEEVPTEQLRALTGLTGAASLGAYRGGELGIKQQLADVAKQKADSYQQSIQNHLSLGLKNIDIKALLAGSTVELNKTREILNNALAATAQERVDLGYYGVDANNATRQAVSNAMSQLGMDKSHPVAQMIDSLLGTGLTPAAPQAPGGAQPVRGPAPLPSRNQTKPQTPKGKRVISF